MKKFHLLGAIALLLFGCKSGENQPDKKTVVQETSDVSVIQPIDFNGNTPKIYQVDAQKASEISLPSGSKITFPENAFVDEAGNPVQGKVAVSWQEFHSLTDIMLSGIPMKYDSAGVTHHFESGGMFTIAASQSDKKLELAPGKKATVDLVSIQDSPCYNFYEIDTKTGDWDYLATKTGTPVPGAPIPVEKKVKTTTLDVQPSNIQDFPELRDKDIIAWKTNDEIHKKTVFALKKSPAKSTISASKIPGNYIIEAKTDKQTFTFEATPLTLEEALKASKTNEKKVEKEQQEYLDYQAGVASGKIIRSFDIPGFGTYNWDRIQKIDEPMSVFADFNFPEDVNPKLVSIFLVIPEKNLQVRYSEDDFTNFFFSKKEKNYIVAILPNNKVMTVGNRAFEEAAKQKFGSQFMFNLKDSGVTLSQGSDLANVLKQLVNS